MYGSIVPPLVRGAQKRTETLAALEEKLGSYQQQFEGMKNLERWWEGEYLRRYERLEQLGLS